MQSCNSSDRGLSPPQANGQLTLSGHSTQNLRPQLTLLKYLVDRRGRYFQLCRNFADRCSRSPKASNPVAIQCQRGTSQGLPPELRIPQPSANTLLNQRPFKLRHRTDDLEHQPPRRGGQIQVVTEADKSNSVRVEISEGVDEVLERPPEAVNLPAQHDIEVPPVSIGHKAIQF